MTIGIKIRVNERLYLRDPLGTDLGKRIIKHSILLIDEIGFESFTFKKLAKVMGSTEASIYRYFENKHLLLLFLTSWFWEWMTFLIEINTMNIQDPIQKLKIIIATMVDASRENPAVEYVNESILHRIIIAEGAKTYRTKSVDQENQDGFFLNYKMLVTTVGEVISAIKPNFPYPCAMATTLFEMANNHIYFAQHIPELTDVHIQDNLSEVTRMLEFFAFSLLQQHQN